MPDYRLYLFENGHIVQGQFVVADDDAAAIERAQELAGDHPAELWSDTVKIHIFNPVL
jgi:hypothetical protein